MQALPLDYAHDSASDARPRAPLVRLKRVAVSEREFFMDNILVRIHLIIEMILMDRPCAMGVRVTFVR